MNKPINISDIRIQTDRLILRPWKEADLNDLFAYASVDGVGQMAGWIPHKDIGVSQEILLSFIAGNKTFALEYQGHVIGSLGVEKYREDLYPQLDNLQGREIGYVLSKTHWGQGLMPEAVNAVVDWLFHKEQLDFIMVGHFDWNHQSRRVIEKCGFRYLRNAEHTTRYETVETCLDYILYHPERRDFPC